MASHETEKRSDEPQTAPHLAVAMPPKATLSDSNSSTLSPSREKSFDLQQSSGISTPRSFNQVNPFDTDIEAMVPATSTDTRGRKSTNVDRGDCQVWPGKDHWKQKAKAAKLKRSRITCLAQLSKRTRIAVKILIGLLIVGIAVGVGFGVSKPLGAPIWGKKDD